MVNLRILAIGATFLLLMASGCVSKSRSDTANSLRQIKLIADQTAKNDMKSRGGRVDFERDIQQKINSGELKGVQDLNVTYPDGSTHQFNTK